VVSGQKKGGEMASTIWRVEAPRTTKDFADLKDALKYLREYTEGNIYQIDGNFKRLVYFLSHSRLFTAPPSIQLLRDKGN
jgi:hypothetical protein